MATKKEDAAAAKAKKQKIILVIGGVLLLGVGAIQVPKLLNGSSSSAEPAAAAGATEAPATGAPATGAPATVATASVTTSTGGTATMVKVASAPRPTAILAGVSIQNGSVTDADEGQLLRFNLFEVKDPFVPQTSDELSGTTEPTTTPTLSDTEPGTSGTAGATTSGGAEVPAGAATVAPPETTNATIVLNGKAQYLAVKDKFPAGNPLFVLVSLKPKVAKIGVAGGSFADAKTVSIAQGKKVTLVNEATGARYELKLVYTGATPEQTESFTQAEK